MKKAIFTSTILVIFIVIMLLTTACSGGISGDEAKAHINSFLEAVEAEDYEQAATFLHPERPADLKAFFEQIESEADLDFSSGIEVEKYTGFSSSYYDSTVDGSRYALDMDVKVGTAEIEMEIEIVSNENGYGIYNLDVDN